MKKHVRGPTRWFAVFGALALAAVGVGSWASLSLGGPAEPDQPTLGSNSARILDEPGPIVSLPPAEADALAGFDEIDTGNARLAAETAGARFYVSASRRGSDRFCAFAVSAGTELGPRSTFTCLQRGDLGSGAAAVSLQTRAGGIEQPRIYFGLVPDGVSSVRAGDRSAAVSGNAYALAFERGDLAGAFSFQRGDGITVSVPVFGSGGS